LNNVEAEKVKLLAELMAGPAVKVVKQRSRPLAEHIKDYEHALLAELGTKRAS